MQDTIYTNATVVVNVCEGADCQGCPECPERRAVMTGPDVWTQASIDFFCPDPESPDYLAALFRRAHYYGNTKGMGSVDLAVELGHTGGNKPESIPEIASVGHTPKTDIPRASEDGYRLPMPDTYSLPKRPTNCRCPNFGGKVFMPSCDYGKPSSLPVECGDCDKCDDWYRYKIAYRFDRGIVGRPLQTIIVLTGFDSVADAGVAATQISKRNTGPRHRSTGIDPATETYRIVITYADTIGPHSEYLIGIAAVKHGYTATVEHRGVTGTEVAAYIPNDSKVDGAQPSRFAGWCNGVNSDKPDYIYNDGVAVDSPRNLPRPTRESHICTDCNTSKADYTQHLANYGPGKVRPSYREWRDTLAVKHWTDPESVRLSRDAVIDIANALRGGAYADAALAYDGMVISGIYQGPKRLIIDLALQVGIDGQIDHDARQCLKMAWLALE
jgi:hypothetical protein